MALYTCANSKSVDLLLVSRLMLLFARLRSSLLFCLSCRNLPLLSRPSNLRSVSLSFCSNLPGYRFPLLLRRSSLPGLRLSPEGGTPALTAGVGGGHKLRFPFVSPSGAAVISGTGEETGKAS